MNSILILRKPKHLEPAPPAFLQGAPAPVSPGPLPEFPAVAASTSTPVALPFEVESAQMGYDDYFSIGTPIAAFKTPASSASKFRQSGIWASESQAPYDYTIAVDTSIPVATCQTQVRPSLTTDCTVFDLLPKWMPPENPEAWPQRTNVACWHCVHPFETRPVPVVLSWSEREGFRCMGCFCSFNCGKAYIQDTRGMDPLKLFPHNAFFYQRFRRLLRQKNESTDNDAGFPEAYHLIPRAPPRHALNLFGGPKSIQQFRSDSICIDVRYQDIPRPMTIFNSQLLREEIMRDISATSPEETALVPGDLALHLPAKQPQRRGRTPRKAVQTDESPSNTQVLSPIPAPATHTGQARRKRRREDTHIVIENDGRRAEKVRRMLDGRPKSEVEPAVKLHLEACETQPASQVNLTLAAKMEEAEKRRRVRSMRALAGSGAPSPLETREKAPSNKRNAVGDEQKSGDRGILALLGAKLGPGSLEANL